VGGEAIWVTLLGSSETARSKSGFVAVLALPESYSAGRRASGIVVGGGRAEGFFFAVMSY
jgi:hypothetical protein